MPINQEKTRVIPMVVSSDAVADLGLGGRVSQTHIGGVPQLVHFVPVDDEAVYKTYMQPLNAELKAAERAKRGLVPGKDGKLIRCPDGTDCNQCPYGYGPGKCKPFIISLDDLNGYEKSCAVHGSMENDILFKIMCQESVKKLRRMPNGEELAYIFSRLLAEASREEIAKEIGKSVKRVSDLVLKIREVLFDDWHDC